ncbi:hypothetical protein AN958_11628 [Leucoagaricus sp. SymC.cos]|nr:hypothetical protein AN958_11628 [Leucoagaricus sp. SymC.cos]
MAPVSLLAIVPVVLALRSLLRARRSRRRKIPPVHERVLILGASSGIGRSVAQKYAKRGARICIVARREAKVEEVVQECRTARGSEEGVLGCVADFTNVEDMIRVRSLIAEGQPEEFDPPYADLEAIQRTVDVTTAAARANYVGPLIAAVTFIPMLTSTSKSPSILLVSSLASVIPAPTRAIYASTKSASLLLYQALAIEHRGISFSLVMPSTVEGDFRASAVDGGSVREQDPNTHGLKREAVADRCIQAVDDREKTVFMPRLMRLGHLLYWLMPSFIEWRARVKYGF